VNGRVLLHARVFSAVPRGTAFWYENSLGLVEIAVNGASAASALGLKAGVTVRWTD
jgi:S-adenosylmethionine hydrolase